MEKLPTKEIREIAAKRQAERMNELKERLPDRSFDALNKVPPAYLGRLTKALTGTKSKKLLIRAVCEQCVGWEHTLEGIKNCRSFICALHPHRPYRSEDGK